MTRTLNYNDDVVVRSRIIINLKLFLKFCGTKRHTNIRAKLSMPALFTDVTGRFTKVRTMRRHTTLFTKLICLTIPTTEGLLLQYKL